MTEVLSENIIFSNLSSKELRVRSDRIEGLYNQLKKRMTRKQSCWGADLTVLDDPDIAKQPFVIRRAKAFEKTLLEMPIAIEKDDYIVGKSVKDGVIIRTKMPKYSTAKERSIASIEDRLIEVGLAHKTPFYSLVLENGLSGIIAKIDHKITETASCKLSEERNRKLAFLKAMRIECKAVIYLANRYANLAQKLSQKAENQLSSRSLDLIAEVCRRVPEHPPTSFHEAVQSFWLVHYALFSTGTLVSCGRLDQYLYPSFKKDIVEGAITLEESQEIIDHLWLRFNDRAQIIRENFFPSGSCSERDRSCSQAEDEFSLGFINYTEPRLMKAGHRERLLYPEERADAINHLGQNILLSGIKPEGCDGTNELTYICLNSMDKFDLVSPVVTVRLHKNSPHELVHRMAEALQRGGGQPFINNDDIIIQGYVDLEVPIEDARDYANSNCWETMIQGRSDQELIRGINFLLYLELALNQGVSSITGEKLGIDTVNPRKFKSFEELFDAWKAQTDHQIKQAIEYIGQRVEKGTLEHSGHGKYCYNPLLSALTQDCIKRVKDVTRGGARYTIWHLMAESVANAIDSMAAIKRIVFEEKALTMNELLTTLDLNWEGLENLQQRFISKPPKFSRDDDYADEIGHEMMKYFIERTRFHASKYRTIIFPCGVGTFSWIIMSGREVGATPDGRFSSEAVAANLSPTLGADILGPTAAVRSYLKMRVSDLPAGAPIDLRFSSSGLKGEEGVKRLAGFIKTFIELGGNMVTLTVTDVDDLKRAMDEPEKYRHLRVRMGGWTAYFVMLSREQQRIHIKRVEHGLI